MRGFVLGGTSSGVGKTVATMATIHALQEAGHTVQTGKAGPDFIDPSHHEAVTGLPSRTLDLWLEGTAGVRRNYHRGTGDICVVEGVMGLYDGDGSSTAMVAEALDLPVVLVVDAKAGMESVGATALGFEKYAAEIGRDIDVAGIIAQRAHGGRHADGIRDALPDRLTYFGRIPPTSDLEIPDRHLGLHMGDEEPLDQDALEAAAEHLRADRLWEVARTPPTAAPLESRPATDARIAVAQDAAFCFYYPATIERLRERAELHAFAPTSGDELPPCDAVYLPGGYPELHADALEDSPALRALGERASDGLPVFGECGGLMAMSQSLTTTDGETYEMAGILPADVQMHERYQALDHVELEARRDVPTASTGTRLRGHEFHYSSATCGRDARFAFDVERGDGIEDNRDGLVEHRSLGTYCHAHAESGAFDAFVEGLTHG
ncbi:MAG: cobyrinic acid a,c-diamide synthase [Haloglomus sp.]